MAQNNDLTVRHLEDGSYTILCIKNQPGGAHVYFLENRKNCSLFLYRDDKKVFIYNAVLHGQVSIVTTDGQTKYSFKDKNNF